MNKKQLRDLVIRVLQDIELYSDDAVELILGTIAQESKGGEYIKQLGNGPALGICQMESATFKDIIDNFLQYKQDLARKIKYVSGVDGFKAKYLEYNLAFSIAMCRVHYLRVNESLPSSLDGWAKYWKQYYNTYLGKGTEEEYINNYKKYVL